MNMTWFHRINESKTEEKFFKYAEGRKEEVVMVNNKTVPIWEKSNLTLEEASAYSGIGINKIRDLSMERNCNFVLYVGTKRLIKRRQFDAYIDKAYSI